MVLEAVASVAVLEPKALVAVFASPKVRREVLVAVKVFQQAPALTLPVELNV